MTKFVTRKLLSLGLAVAIAAVLLIGVTGCGSLVSVNYLMYDGLVPFDYFQGEKTKDERLVSISPVLFPEQQESYIYIITNPADIEKAQASFDNQDISTPAEINKALKECSPILIRSSNLTMLGTSTVIGNGIAIFHLPAANKIFYVFLAFEKDSSRSASEKTKIWHDVLSLSSLPENVRLEFSNVGESLKINTVRDSKEITKRFNDTKGMYGWYLTSGTTRASGEEAKQLGFIELGFSERYKYARLTREQYAIFESAYSETVKPIEQKGKRILVEESTRQAFIRRYQGNPDTARVANARNQEHQQQRNLNAAEQEIVALAKKEPNNFIKVRIIHDWVADVFAYDMDLLGWMENVSNRNAKFSLEQIEERRRGVCFEYAILFWYLMDAAGIDTYLISDLSGPDGHAYNMVVINGTGYIVDTTWDSGNKYQGGRITESAGMKSKVYFMPDITQSYINRRSQGW
jgi:hypothetical protein